MAEYSFLQKLRIAFWGSTPVGKRKLPHWDEDKEPIMFYAHNCPIHGIVEDYPHGFGSGRLICPQCIESKDEH